VKEPRVGINGFGRIGRCVARILLQEQRLTLAGINDLANIGDLAYLLKYDSVHGVLANDVRADGASIRVGDRRIPFFAVREPEAIPWREVNADVVIESTGAFRKRERAAGHIAAGTKRVIISAPSDDADGMFVLGVNDDRYDPARHRVVSMASCTTNSLAPVAKVLHAQFGIEHLFITTVHAYTSSQSVMDTPMRKRRRGRAAAVSIIPTTTGAARATARVLPELDGKLDGLALRVPVADGSITDIVAMLARPVTTEAINDALRVASAKPPLKGILKVSDDELVSRDIVGDPHSSIVDAKSTMVLRDRVAKILVWYDNEYGYARRLVDFVRLVAEHP
jgi:glyceraldehyde 3-phosphate dehydrogenase (phosphorylating)